MWDELFAYSSDYGLITFFKNTIMTYFEFSLFRQIDWIQSPAVIY